jgi:trans-aconitate methyltransferase
LNNILPAASIAADNFISKEEISAILKESFGKISVKETRHKQVLPSLKALLEKIKYTGTRGEPLNTKKHFTPRLLQKIENAYLDKFKKISATFQIFFFKVKKT